MKLFSLKSSTRESLKIDLPMIRDFIARNSVFLGFAAMFIFFTLANESFVRWDNMLDILLRMCITAPVAYGVMLSLIVKGIDLSCGTIMGLVGLIIAGGISSGMNLALSLLLATIAGGVIGVVNAFLIARANMNPFIATISILFIGNSIEKVATKGGLPIYLYPLPKALDYVYRGSALGVPFPIIALLTITVLLLIFLESTIFGRKMYASGDGIKASRTSGIPVRFYYGFAYFISAMCAVISGIFLCSQVRSGQPLVGHSYIWDAIGAAYLSTIVSRRHFRPNVLGTLFGTFVMSIVANGFTLMGVAFYWKEFAKGIVILLILVLSVIKRKYQRG